ncbi:MAG: sigma-54 dependent transcriptional regulator [Mariprofundales bacterium]
MADILLVDDEANARLVMSLNLQQRGHMVTECSGAAEALRALDAGDYDVVVTDLRMEQADSGLQVVQKVATNGSSRVLLLTAYASADTAVSAMKMGAFDYLTKPVSADDLAAAIERVLQDMVVEIKPGAVNVAAEDQGMLLGDSLPMQRVRERLLRAAKRDFTVLISGESGTGKELSARFVHAASARAAGPLVVVHCAAIPEGLFESELFGHCKGAFTGADQHREGLVEAANGGTLFLDEVGEMPPSAQVKMLRMLQEHKVRRVGEQVERTVDVRVIAATNRDLDDEVKQGRFREDLFYRLNVVPVHLPPLRQRRDDLPLLISTLLSKITGDDEQPAPEALVQRVTKLPMMGNVRELENMLQRLVALSDEGGLDLSLIDDVSSSGMPTDLSLAALKASGVDLDVWMARIERELLQQAMAESEASATKAAKLLGVSFRSMRYRLQKLGLKEG